MKDLRQYMTIVEAQENAYRIKLPYSRSDLDPVISKDSIDLHYGKLHQAYVDKANRGEGGDFAIAGAVLHNIWWEQFQPPAASNVPTGKILEIIEKTHDSFSQFKINFSEQAKTIQGSGWCYLSKGGDIKTIKNHEIKNDIAVLIDMWEHAMIDYNLDKEKYLAKIWQIINWGVINSRL